jgi:hypothetical protein
MFKGKKFQEKKYTQQKAKQLKKGAVNSHLGRVSIA